VLLLPSRKLTVWPEIGWPVVVEVNVAAKVAGRPKLAAPGTLFRAVAG